ncbi:hypothetical protein [Labrys wisconsinensis]|uniref:Uncharacterized protein n=1 Tax=Labrys wisconsinensis TaxID=425677 RepID=A0ABU0JHD7_9HYPH|nr:hypothetical protein [Labrys wisconsinensis]MDQ0473709.1 hypothetical protein [Labrys wisconsinensis]
MRTTIGYADRVEIAWSTMIRFADHVEIRRTTIGYADRVEMT